MSTGDYHTCAIRTDRSLICWGGSGGSVPTGTFVAVSVGSGSTCAISTDGQLACWGDIGTKVPAGTFSAVSTSGGGACAIRTDGTLACWEGASEDDIPPLSPPAGTFTAVDVESWPACAIRTDGTLACWGDMGDPPLSVPAGEYTDLGVPCAIRTDGALVCFRHPENWEGGTPPDGTFMAVSGGGMDTRACAIRTDGSLACWGQTTEFDAEGNEVPAMAPPSGAFATVDVGYGYACAKRTDGTVVCWGNSGSSAETPAPEVTIRLPRPWLAATRIPIRWSAAPLFTPIAAYDISYTWTRWDGKPGPETPTTWLTGTKATSGTFKGRPGYTYCFEVSAVDTDGVRSNWHWPACTAVPLDDRAFARSAGWTKISGRGYYLSTALRSTSRGSQLVLGGTEGLAIGLMATTCPTCGSIVVTLDGERSEAISLRSSKTVHRRIVWEFGNDEGVGGKVTIKVVSRGKPVIIDGLVVNREIDCITYECY